MGLVVQKSRQDPTCQLAAAYQTDKAQNYIKDQKRKNMEQRAAENARKKKKPKKKKKKGSKDEVEEEEPDIEEPEEEEREIMVGRSDIYHDGIYLMVVCNGAYFGSLSLL